MKQKSLSSRSSSAKGETLEFKFLVPVYGDMVLVVITDDTDLIRKRLTEYETSEESIEDCLRREAFCVQMNEERGALMIIRPKHHMTWSNLYHEIFHIKIGIMQNAGCKLCPESEEAYSHLGEDLFATIAEGLVHHGIELYAPEPVATLELDLKPSP